MLSASEAIVVALTTYIFLFHAFSKTTGLGSQAYRFCLWGRLKTVIVKIQNNWLISSTVNVILYKGIVYNIISSCFEVEIAFYRRQAQLRWKTNPTFRSESRRGLG